MRVISRKQQELQPQNEGSIYARELAEIDRILRELPGQKQLLGRVRGDLLGRAKDNRGMEGMTVEQVVRCNIVRTLYGLSYRELEFALEDSASIRKFVGLGFGQQIKRSALNRNIRLIGENTWKEFNERIKEYAEAAKVESGTTVRGDTTTVKTNIHYPTDINLLWDCVRVLTRVMNEVSQRTLAKIEFIDHTRRAKTKLYKINNSRKERIRHKNSLELIRVTRRTIFFAEQALEVLSGYTARSMEEVLATIKAEGDLKQYIPLAKHCVLQAYRRHVQQEEVPNEEKIVSIFEPHTDILVKGFRDVVFGHKISLVTGKSSLILDCDILKGNPADTSLVQPMLEQHLRSYGTAPEQIALDGGFASKPNAQFAKNSGVKDVMFSKTRGLENEQLVSSPRALRMLRRFRAGVEANISLLKRKFGLRRILEKGFDAFKSVVRATVVTFNLLLIARSRLRPLQT
jgi:IS5 family transposase